MLCHASLRFGRGVTFLHLAAELAGFASFSRHRRFLDFDETDFVLEGNQGALMPDREHRVGTRRREAAALLAGHREAVEPIAVDQVNGAVCSAGQSAGSADLARQIEEEGRLHFEVETGDMIDARGPRRD